MDLHQLLVFTKVAEHKSFSKAAEDIYLSQSTVSSHVQALEKGLNGQLIDRIGRDISLTPQGERLYQWAKKILLLTDEALLDLKSNHTDFRGMIRIAASSVPEQFLLPKIVKQFNDQYPHAIFHIFQSSSKTVAEKVINGSVDLGIIGGKYENDNLTYIPLLKEKLVLIAANQLDLTAPISNQELLRHPFIMRNNDSGTRALLEQFLLQNQIPKEQLNTVAYVENGQSLIQFVIQNLGISIISELAAKTYVKKGIVKMYPLADFDAKRYFYLVYNKHKTHSILAKLLIEQVRNIQL